MNSCRQVPSIWGFSHPIFPGEGVRGPALPQAGAQELVIDWELSKQTQSQRLRWSSETPPGVGGQGGRRALNPNPYPPGPGCSASDRARRQLRRALRGSPRGTGLPDSQLAEAVLGTRQF